MDVVIRGTSWCWSEYARIARCFLWPRLFDSRPLLRRRLAEMFAAPVELLNSGRSALELALKSVGELTWGRQRRSVLVPSLICRCVPEKVVRCGMTPVFYDVTPEMSPCVRSAENQVRPDTVAVIHPYLYGKVNGIEEMSAVCRRFGLYLIEDCAAAFLLQDGNGRLAGSTGDFVILSFQEGKTVVAGSGGALIDRTSRGPLQPPVAWSAWEERRLCVSKISFAIRKVWKTTGYALQKLTGEIGRSYADWRQDEVREMAAVDAEVILHQMKRWAELFARKRAILKRYERNLAGSPLRLPQLHNSLYVGRMFVEFPEPVVERAEDTQYESALIRALRRNGIQTQLSYYPAHRLAPFTSYPAGPLPNTDRLYRSVIEVPTQPELREEQIDFVCESLLAMASCRPVAVS